jgi:hypothetical protein
MAAGATTCQTGAGGHGEAAAPGTSQPHRESARGAAGGSRVGSVEAPEGGEGAAVVPSAVGFAVAGLGSSPCSAVLDESTQYPPVTQRAGAWQSWSAWHTPWATLRSRGPLARPQPWQLCVSTHTPSCRHTRRPASCPRGARAQSASVEQVHGLHHGPQWSVSPTLAGGQGRHPATTAAG